MRLVWLWGLLAALPLGAGIVQGVVMEQASGHPLARTRVRLQPIGRTAASDVQPIQLRTGPAGQFSFLNVPDGIYLLTAMRDSYFDAGYGQRRPDGLAVPFTVTHDSDLYAQLLMRRMGAITGRVVDENNIGMAGVPVIAYRARLPLRAAARATSDDRGVYRIHGLAPGRYWVRSGPATLEDGASVLPTFSPEAREVQQARYYEARLDTDTPDGDVRPLFGNLFRLHGPLQCTTIDATPINVTLSSETGRRTLQSTCLKGYVFEGLAPGAYEVFAAKEGNQETGWAEVFADVETSAPVRLMPPPRVEFEVRRAGSSAAADLPVALSGKRQDLSEAEFDKPIEMPSAVLPQGHWEFWARPGPSQYVESISSLRTASRRVSRTQYGGGWDVFIETGYWNRIRITLSDQAGQIAGRVMSEGKGATGAPVFLWPQDANARRSLHGWQQLRADVEGRFRFDGLPPGDYRLLATFDISELTEEALEEAHAVSVRVAASQKVDAELPLWIAP